MRVFLLLLLGGVRAQTPQASQMFGTLESPNFPDQYPGDSALRWNLSVPDGFRIRLSFSHFDLEPSYLCEYDSVQVEAGGEVLALFCGSEGSDTEAVPGLELLFSPRNSLSLSFLSDFSNEEKFSGFRAHYSAQDVDECIAVDEDLPCDHFCHNFIGGFYCSCRYGYQLHADNRTCTVECSDGVFRERSGVLSSVDFPSPYPKSSDCSLRIQVPPGFRLRLHFHPNFDIEDHPEVSCPYDQLRVVSGSRTFGPFCGTRAPDDIETDGHEATVMFHSDDSGENVGWRLTYTTIGSTCAAPEAPLHALLTPVQSEYSFKDHILFTCSTGFTLLQDGEALDHLQIVCQSDGSWSSSPPRCQDTGRRRRRALSSILTNHSQD
ncbi:hypothetical protein CesoFtcFv8_005709 [Champsocephalus esox]|uniref:Mannan-binding lectin serine protease 1 n=1 Tax=Champsocephalus esox TaxID=159716 RepID=A0AAN8CIA8_9TELE|nr:hypothetical protein CesoFtcFv8_005709 [Champsocephalus esox]